MDFVLHELELSRQYAAKLEATLNEKNPDLSVVLIENTYLKSHISFLNQKINCIHITRDQS